MGQSFTLLKLVLDGIKYAGHDELPGMVSEAGALVDEATARVRRVSRHLRPGMLDLSLEQSLEWLAQETGRDKSFTVKVRWRGPEDDGIPQEIIASAYRVTQEALDNAARHAGVNAARIDVEVMANELRLRIADGGCGFDLAGLVPGSRGGLIYMMERAAMAGGSLGIESRKGGGTTIFVIFSLPRVKANLRPLC
jgi:signal transduction histidine kinase